MSRYCPVQQAQVIYMTCQECEDRICESIRKNNRPEKWQKTKISSKWQKNNFS